MWSGHYGKTKCGLGRWFTEYVDNQPKDVASFPSKKSDLQESAHADGTDDCLVIVPVTPHHILLLYCGFQRDYFHNLCMPKELWTKKHKG